MMAALGVGAYTAGVFHLFTHAIFKALLFLGAGSLIHAVHSNNMSDMGGLRKYMPHTFKTFMIGSLGLAGIFPLAGFFSKDEIIGGALRQRERGPPGQPRGSCSIAAIVTAFLTALYMTRSLRQDVLGRVPRARRAAREPRVDGHAAVDPGGGDDRRSVSSASR